MFSASIRLYKNAYSGIPKPVWWLGVVMFVNRSGTMVIPFLTIYLIDRGYTLTQAGYVMGAFGLGSIGGGYLGGRLTDKFGFYYVQLVSLLLNGLLFIVLGQMQTLPQFAACIFVLSTLGESFRPANAAAIAHYSTDDNRTRCYALNRLAINLGWSIGPAVGGLLADYNYSLLFWADGATCIVASAVLFFALPPLTATEKIHQPNVTEKSGSAYTDRPFLLAMALLFIVAFCFFQLFSVIPAFYKSQLGMNKAAIGLLLALSGVFIALVEMVLVYKLENRRPAIYYIIIGAAFMGASFGVLPLGSTVVIASISMFLVTVGEMFLFPFLNSFWVGRSQAHNRGEYAAIYTMSFAAATVLAPTVATQIASHLGFTTLWLTDAALCFAAAGFFYLLKKNIE